MMKWLHLSLGICLLALASAVKAAAPWTIEVFPYGVTPTGVTFNGQRTVNSSGVSIWDVDLGSAPWIEKVTPYFINDLGQVAGVATFDSGTVNVATVSTNGVLTIIGGNRTRPTGINNLGQVIYSGGFYGGLWPRSDLGNDQFPYSFFQVPGYAWGVLVTDFININDAGQIYAVVQLGPNGDSRDDFGTAILTPVPEPHALASTLAAFGVIALWWRRRQMSSKRGPYKQRAA